MLASMTIETGFENTIRFVPTNGERPGEHPGALPFEVEDHLIKKAQLGDTEAFGQIVEHYWPSIFSRTMSKIGNSSDAEDICQDTFTKAWQALPRYEHRVSIKHWLFTIATNQTVDLIRQKASRGQSLSLDEGLIAAREESASATLCDLAEKRLLIARIQENLDRLEPNQRQVVFLRVMADWPYQDIAARMDKSVETIRVLLHRGLKEIRAGLNGQSRPKEKKFWMERERKSQALAAIIRLAQEKGQFLLEDVYNGLPDLNRKTVYKYLWELVRSRRLQSRPPSSVRPAVYALADSQTFSNGQGPQSVG